MNKLALVIGHSEQSQGATNKASGVTEYGWNDVFVHRIAQKIWNEHNNIPDTRIFQRGLGIRDLVKRINDWNPDLAVEFHLNAFDTQVSGTEMLVSNIHNRGNSIFANEVDCFATSVGFAIGIQPRGIKFVGRFGKGGYFLNKTKCRAIIAETFFIDNDSDLAKANENYDKLVQCYVDWFVKYFEYFEEDK